MTEAYPLQWPAGKPRTRERKAAQFGKQGARGGKVALTIADAIGRLQREIDALGARQYVLSSNLELRLDGMPRSNQAEPLDTGIALYFQLSGHPHCMACDTYYRAADNIAAIAKHIEATRAIERYGVANLAEMFAGFVSLPQPGLTRPWWEVLGVSQYAAIDQINAAYRDQAKRAHVDAGGSDAAMTELNVARDQGLKARKEQP
jgi:hypothetical protein